MLTRSVFHLLQRGTVPDQYRKKTQTYIQQEPAIALLPELLRLPLGITSTANSTDKSLRALLEEHRALALRGPLGSGRSLALFQLLWNRTSHKQADPVLLLPLAQVDDFQASPRTIVASAIQSMGLP